MLALSRFAAALRGLSWVVRRGGLRDDLGRLADRLAHVERRLAAPARADVAQLRADVQAVGRRLAEPPPPPAVDAALPEIVTTLRNAIILLQRLDGRSAAADEAARREAWRSVGDLRGFERKVYSQQGEDGIIEEVFRRVGAGSKFFVEFGVQSGDECNSARLAKECGWGGVFLEVDPDDHAKLAENYRAYPAVRCERARVTSDTVEDLFAACGVPEEFDLLSIDIDGNDYWVWRAITRYRPRVVAIEYNPFHRPPDRWVMAEDPDFRWGRTTYFGASLAALYDLGRRKGYTLVGTDSRGVNAFFVRDDVAAGHFLDPALHYHFTPFGYPPPPPGDGPAVRGAP